MDEERVRSSLRRVADGAPEPNDLRADVQRRVVFRRRRLVALSVAAALVVGFSSAVAFDAVDEGVRVEVVPAKDGPPHSADSSTRVVHPTSSVAVTPVTAPPQSPGAVVWNSTDSWIAATRRVHLACPASQSSGPPCGATGNSDTVVLLPPGRSPSIALPRSNVGEVAWVVVDAPRERVFFGVSSGCDPGVSGTWVIGFDGATARHLSLEGDRPAVSPDGRFIAQTGQTDGCGSRRLVVQEIASDRRFSYEADESLGGLAWVDNGSALLVGRDGQPGALRFPISPTGAIADAEPVEALANYRVVDSNGDSTLLAVDCPPHADCSHHVLGYEIARNGVIEREILCPNGGCARSGEPRLGPNGTDILWVSSDAGAWGVDALGDQQIRLEQFDGEFVLLTESAEADW